VKIVRVSFAVSLALLAAAPAWAAVEPSKPPPAAASSDEAKRADTSDVPSEPAAPQAEAPRRPGAEAGSWRDALPAWLTDSGLPVWAWGLLAVVAFLVLRGLFRRDDRRDLIGPPRGMRLGARPAPTAQRSVPPVTRR